MKNGKLVVAFDTDDCLIIPKNVIGASEDTPNYEVIALARWFQANGHHLIIWSGGGVDWAKRWGEKLGLEPFEVRVKEKSEDVDIAFDDCDVDLAKVNVKVKRINNSISRKEWNSSHNSSIDK